MAFNILTQPDNIRPVYSPVYYRVQSDIATGSGYKYTFSVTVDGNVVATVKVLPDPSGVGMIDVSKILRNYLTYDANQTISAAFTVAPNSLLEYSVAFTEEMTGGVVTGVANQATALTLTIHNVSLGSFTGRKLLSGLILPGLTLSSGTVYLDGSNHTLYTADSGGSAITATGTFSPNGFVQTVDLTFGYDAVSVGTPVTLFALNAVQEYDKLITWNNAKDYRLSDITSKFLTTYPSTPKTIYPTDYETLSFLPDVVRQYLVSSGTINTENNGGFNQGLKYWTQYVTSAGQPEWTASNGQAHVYTAVSSTILWQNVYLYSGLSYTYEFDYNIGADLQACVMLDDGTGAWTQVGPGFTGTGHASYSHTMLADTCRIGIYVTQAVSTTTPKDCWIDNFAVSTAGFTGTFHAPGEIDYMQVKTYNSVGGLIASTNITNTEFVYLNMSDSSYVTPDNARMDIGIGPMNFDHLTTNPLRANGVATYTVQMFGKDCCVPAASTPLSQVFTYDLVSPANRYDTLRLTWLNSLGGWDYYTLKLTGKQDKLTKKVYEKVKPWNYTSADRGDTVYNSSYETNYSGDTDWMSVEESAWFAELYRSGEVYILKSDGSLYPVVITDSIYSYRIKGVGKDKLTQYTVGMKTANTAQANV